MLAPPRWGQAGVTCLGSNRRERSRTRYPWFPTIRSDRPVPVHRQGCDQNKTPARVRTGANKLHCGQNSQELQAIRKTPRRSQLNAVRRKLAAPSFSDWLSDDSAATTLQQGVQDNGAESRGGDTGQHEVA